jgi:hypothetical protein
MKDGRGALTPLIDSCRGGIANEQAFEDGLTHELRTHCSSQSTERRRCSDTTVSLQLAVPLSLTS